MNSEDDDLDEIEKDSSNVFGPGMYIYIYIYNTYTIYNIYIYVLYIVYDVQTI